MNNNISLAVIGNSQEVENLVNIISRGWGLLTSSSKIKPASLSKTYYLGEYQRPVHLHLLLNPNFFPKNHINGVIIPLAGQLLLRDAILKSKGLLGCDIELAEVIAVYLLQSERYPNLERELTVRGFDLLKEPLVEELDTLIERVYQKRKELYLAELKNDLAVI